MDDYKLFDAEYRLMDLVWTQEPVNSTALSRMCLERFGWKKPTTYNLIRKLCQRGFLKNEGATVTALVPREQVVYGPLYRNPRRIFGIGLNYAEHAGGIGNAPPQGFPGRFFKMAETLIGPGG